MGDNNEEVLVPTTKAKAAAKPKAAAAAPAAAAGAGSATKKSRNPYTLAERKEAAEQVLTAKLGGKKFRGIDVTELSRAIGTSRNQATLKRIINSLEKKEASKKPAKPASASKKAAPAAAAAAAAPRVSAAASLLAPAGIVPSKKDLKALTAAIGTAAEEEVLNSIVTAAAAAPNKKGTKKANREAQKVEFERFKREAHADLKAAANGEEPTVSNVERLAAIRMSGSTLSVANYMVVKRGATARKGRKGAKPTLAAAEFHPAAMDPCDQCRMKLMLMNDPAERRAAIRKLREGMAKNDMLEGRKFVYNTEAVMRRESNRDNRSASRRARRANLKAAAGRVSQSPLRPYRGTRKAFRFQTEGTGY
jgi:hypothetical protein